MPEPRCPYVSRGGLKLAAALDAFRLDAAGLVCADLGCSTGGFTDCLLQRQAAHVFAVDTAYGTLEWKLRNDPHVTVLERTNAIHLDPAELPRDARPTAAAACDLVVIDLGWTKQERAIPAAMRWLKDSPAARIVTLIKPQYEASPTELRPGRDRKGVLDDATALRVAERVIHRLHEQPDLRVIGQTPSPIRGGATRGRKGNTEYLALLARR